MMLRETTFTRLGKAWDKFFFEPEDVFWYSFFRIAFGALLLVHNAAMYPSIDFFYGEHGPLPFAASRLVVGSGAWTVFAWLPKTSAALWSVYWVFTAAAATLFLGLFSRVSAIVVYICMVSFQHRNNLVTDGEDTVFRIFGLMMIFMPLGNYLSIDRVIALLRGKKSPEERKAAPVALRIVQIYMCFMYFSACWWKLKGREWLEGTAMYYVSRLDDFYGRFPTPKFPFEYLPLTKVITWSVLWVEGLTPFLVWFKETRLPILLVALSFHFGCDYSMNLFMFHWVMALGWLCFLSEAEIRRVAAFFSRAFRLLGIRPVVLSFNGDSKICQRLAAVLSECDIFSFLSLENGQPAQGIEVSTRRGVKLSGFSAVRYALRSVPVAWPVLPLFYLPGAAALGNRWTVPAPEAHPSRRRKTGRAA